MKNSAKIGILSLILVSLIAIPFALGVQSATFDNDVTIQTSNSPTIGPVDTLDATYDPTENTTTTITVWFVATDQDGYHNLDNTTAEAQVTRAGEATRSNTSCTAENLNWSSNNYTCTIDMYFYDETGSWSIEASIDDDDANSASNTSETFTYNTLSAIGSNNTAVSFGTQNVGATDVAAEDDPIGIQNTGNQNITSLDVTAIDLQGTTYSDYYIPAGNFEGDGDDSADDSTALVNNTATTISDPATLYIDRGASSWEALYFHLDVPSTDIQAQLYDTSGLGQWTITGNS